MTARAAMLSLAAAAMLATPVRARAQDSDRYPTRIDTIVPVSGSATVDLSLIAGRIRVTAWDRPAVKVVASVTDGEGRLHFSAGTSKVSLEVEYGDDQGRRNRDIGEAHYDVTVPRGTRLSLDAVSGDIEATGVGGEVEAQSVSGSVNVSDVKGTSTAESVSGAVRASNVIGDIHSEAVSGDVTITNVTGDVSAETVSGTVLLDAIRSSSVRAETVSGGVTYTGSIDDAGRYRFETHSGTLTLNLPGNVGAVFSVTTFSGDINSNIPMTMQPGQGKSSNDRIEFTVGNGKAKVSAETFSGRIIIHSAGASGAIDRRQD